MFYKTIFALSLSLFSLSSFSKITDSLTVEKPFDYCATQFPIKSCSSDECSSISSIMTDAYMACSNSFLNINTEEQKAPIGLLSFQNYAIKDNKNPSYLIFSYRYQSLIKMAVVNQTNYDEMKKAQKTIDANYDNFLNNNPILKKAFTQLKPFDTQSKKDTYTFIVNSQKQLGDKTNQYKNAVNFMLFSPEFYQQFLMTYNKYYPYNMYSGFLQNKELNLYECQFINIMDNFPLLQSQFQFTCKPN